ncbi:MAG: aldo/keto reductase [Anaerolineae bacterium]|jgi:aryl-alcohol dehydrogenase-like predicted oxidoreductase
MQYRQLGHTDITVSALGLGCWAFGGGPYWGDRDDERSIETIHAALDAGINSLDTAEGYGDGRSEMIVGRALAGRRQEAIIATKVSSGHLAPDDVRLACEASLRRLQTDYIDLYQIHWPSREVPIQDTMAALQRLREEGKVRAVGVSNFGPLDLSEVLAVGRVESNQLPYSLLWRAIEYEIQDLCVANDISILCYSPLAQGLLSGRWRSADEVPQGRAVTRFYSSARPGARHGEPGAEPEVFEALAQIEQIAADVDQPMADLALAWLLHRPGVTSVLAGAGNPAQVRANALAADLRLDPDVIDRLDRATDALKAKLGANPDMWQSESRYR